MDTFFASAERSTDEELKKEIEAVSENPVIDGVLGVVGGLIAVLNEHRQILAANQTLLTLLGIDDEEKVLGIRPGEALQCIHAKEEEGGCGTSKFCSTCGAAISIVSSLGTDAPVERMCAVTVLQNDRQTDLYFRVRSCPIEFSGRRFLLLFLQDITQQQQWAVLERAFYHDINNLVTGLIGASEMLAKTAVDESNGLAGRMNTLIMRLAQEVKIQQCLNDTEAKSYTLNIQRVSVEQIFAELKQIFHNHPAAIKKKLNLIESDKDFFIKTDCSLVMRVLGNMVLNALEASCQGDEVKVWAERREQALVFAVWNGQVIDADTARRIFQRNFSTKQEIGRGLGTYSMKLFGEDLLGGQVEFTSTTQHGTQFQFCLPL